MQHPILAELQERRRSSGRRGRRTVLVWFEWGRKKYKADGTGVSKGHHRGPLWA